MSQTFSGSDKIGKSTGMGVENLGQETVPKTIIQDQVTALNIIGVSKGFDEMKEENENLRRQLEDVKNTTLNLEKRTRKEEQKHQKTRDELLQAQEILRTQMVRLEEDNQKRLNESRQKVEEELKQITKKNKSLQSSQTFLVLLLTLLVAASAVFAFYLIHLTQETKISLNEKVKTQMDEWNLTVTQQVENLLVKLDAAEKEKQLQPYRGVDWDSMAGPLGSKSNDAPVPVPASVMRKQISLQKDIKGKSRFEVQIINPIPLLENNIVLVNDFDSNLTASQFMDTRTGVYTTPIKGGYLFRLYMKQVGDGAVDWYLCSDGGDGRREKVDSSEADEDSDWHYSDFNWACNGSENIWVEAFTNDKDISIEVKLAGGLNEL